MMTFIGSVGNLMVSSGLDEILTAAVGGVEKLLNWKTFRLNFSALRMATEELLQPYLKYMDHANKR